MGKLLGLGLAVAAQLSAASVPLHFEPNRGQAPPAAQYLARVRHATVYLTDAGITVASRVGEIRLCLEGAAPRVPWTPDGEPRGTTSYFLGNDSSRWLLDIPSFRRVQRKNIYPGVDLIVYGAEGRLEYDLALRPGANPDRIRLRFTGGSQPQLAGGDMLVIKSAGGELLQLKPTLYQTARDGSLTPVEGRFRVAPDGAIGFAVANYDRSLPLTIDPVLESATLLGGSGDDKAFFADPAVAVVGSTASLDFPGGPTGRRGGIDIFVYQPSTESTTIFGGSGDDIVTCVSASTSGYQTLLIGGYTNSRDFPVIAPGPSGTALQPQYGGGANDGFLLMINIGSSPFFSTYLGGSGDDRVLSVDGTGALWGLFGAAGSTTSTDFPLADAWQQSPGGTTDGFVSLLSLATTQGGYAAGVSTEFSSYLGGAGDDRALALRISSANDFYVGGETSSANWLSAAAVKGTSDGFLIHGDRSGTGIYGRFVAAQAVLWGGSGADRISQIASLPNGNLAIAGVTASADFAAGQTAPTGFHGATDVFAAAVTPDLAAVPFALLIGGSGDEEPLSLATNQFNELLIGGWTSSTDFAQTAPLQSTYGGGASDGFLYHVDSSGQTIWSTYYGGSGADQITSVRFDASQKINFGGYTDSHDLTLANALQSLNAGGVDAFFGTLHAAVIHAEGFSVGKDLAGSGYAFLGDSANYVGVPLTVTSADPSRVLMATRPEDPGEASVTVAIRATDSDLAGRSFLAYCLTDHGTVELTLTAPGYPARSIAVQCVPSALYLSQTNMTVATSGNGQSNGGFSVVTAALDPVTGNVLQIQNPRGGLSPVNVSAVSSDPTVLALQNSSITIDQFVAQTLTPGYGTSQYFPFNTLTLGAVDITVSTSSNFPIAPANTLHVRVTGPMLSSLYVPQLARDFVDRIGFGFNPVAPTSVSVTVTSSDSSKVRLTLDPRSSGMASVTVACCTSTPQIYAEVLDVSGPVSLTASTPNGDSVTTPVVFRDAKLSFFDQYGNFMPSLYMAAGTSSSAYVQINAHPLGVSNPYWYTTPYLRSGAAPVYVSLTNSNPGVAIAPTQYQIIMPGAPLTLPAGSITAAGPGTTTVSASINPTAFATVGVPLTVTVQQAVPFVGSATVGRNLELSVGYSFSSPTAVPVTIVSSDPSRLLLSFDGTQVGQVSIAVNTMYGGSFYAQALADSGDVTVTLYVSGTQVAKGTIHLVPSGLAWNDRVLNLTSGDKQVESILGYTLDPITLVPLTSQALRPGAGTVNLQVGNSGVVTLDANSQAITGMGLSVTLTAGSAGNTTIQIVQPPGFVNPTGKVDLRVNVTAAQFTISSAKVGKFLETSVMPNFPKGLPPAPMPSILVKSSDPSKLLLSTTATDPGGASVSLQPNGSLYVQAIDGPADVNVTASLAGYPDTSAVMEILPTTLTLVTNTYYQGTSLETNTQAGPQSLYLSAAPLGVSFYQGEAGQPFWPGMPEITVNITNSNPAAVTVTQNPILNALTSWSVFPIKPVGAGVAYLTPVYPAGFTANPTTTRFKVTVDGPAFTLPNVTLGRDLETSLPLGVGNGSPTPPNDVDVVFTSSDPSKVLLATGAGVPGTASVTVHLFANQSISNTGIYAQALADQGTVNIQITAAGYNTGSATVTLSATVFYSWQSSPVTLNIPNSYGVTLYPAPTTSQYYGGSGYSFRAGTAPFTITPTASTAGIVTVSPAQATVSGGVGQVAFTIKAAGAGATTLSFPTSGPYQAAPALSVTVQAGQINFYPPGTIGQNLQASVQLNTPLGVNVTVTSSDSSRLLVSASASLVGQGSITTSQPTVYLQGIGNSGTVTVTATSPGYQSATASVTLTPTAAIFSSTASQTLTTLSPPSTYTVELVPYGTGYYYYSPQEGLRAGATPVTVPVTLSMSAVGSVSAAQLTFNPGDSAETFTFQPLAAGSELMTLGVPSGFTDPLSLRQVLLNVTAQRLVFTGFSSVGKNLQTSITARLAAPPAQTVALTVNSSDATRLELGQSNGTLGPSLNLSFQPNGANSVNFNIAGLSDSGSAALSLAGSSLPSETYSVELLPSGFHFSSTVLALTQGGSATGQIVPCTLVPVVLIPADDSAIRTDIGAPIPITIANSEPTVVTVSPGPIYLYGGEGHANFSIRGLAPGVATLTISTPPGWSTPSTGNKMLVLVH